MPHRRDRGHEAPRAACLRTTVVAAIVTVGLLGLGLGVDQVGAATAGQASAEAAAAAEPRFDVFEYVVVGNTALDRESIERAVMDFLGPGRRFDDVEAARRSLELAYRRAGFGFASVDIPEQRVDAGVVRLVVTEGRIARTRVTGSRYFSQGYILSRVTAGAEGQVPHLPTLQGQLSEVNRSADRRVTPLLRPGRSPGTTELDLVVEDRLPVNGSVVLNNQAGRNTSDTRLQVALGYDNLWQQDHSLSVQAAVSPQKLGEVQVLSANYSVPLGPGRLESLSLTLTRSDSEVFAGATGALGDTRLVGRGTAAALRRSWILALEEGDFQQLVLSLEYKDMTDTVELLGAGAGDPTPIRYAPLGLGWTRVVRAAGGDWQLGASLSGGLRGLINQQQAFANKRYEAQASYALWRLDARHQRTLPIGGLRMRAQLESQVAPAPLVSNEQFAIGGANSVRGYLEAEAVGDLGLRGSLQLGSPNLAARWRIARLTELDVHGFVDAAAAEVRRPLPGQASRARLAGLGFGLSLATAAPWPVSLTLDLAWPVKKSGLIGSDGPRLHGSASLGF